MKLGIILLNPSENISHTIYLTNINITSTATKNVYILDENYILPNLGRTRRLWVYLPPTYQTSGISYPVIYMQDGQNLFDELNAFGSEWGVDETLDLERGNIIQEAPWVD